jgi:hypothetical protein
MTSVEEVAKARHTLEQALQEYVRLTRDLPNVFIQDYVILTASESMEPGHENITYLNHLNRMGMPIYSVVGLLESGKTYYAAMSKANG